MDETKQTNKLSYDILLKMNEKLVNESKIFHKVSINEQFTIQEILDYAQSQVQALEDELELYRVLKEDYIHNDYLPDVKKIQTFENLIEGAQVNIAYYHLMINKFKKIQENK